MANSVPDNGQISTRTNIHIRGQSVDGIPQVDVHLQESEHDGVTEGLAHYLNGNNLYPDTTALDELPVSEISRQWSLEAETGLRHLDSHTQTSLAARFWNDQLAFYSPESLILLSSGIVVGGTLANTGADEHLQTYTHASFLGPSYEENNELFHSWKSLGDQNLTLPIFLSSWAVGYCFEDFESMDRLSTWGERSTRGLVLGFPPLMALQFMTGGSRPGETSEGSEWQPFTDNNGVSGHAFVGSLPFITAAKMSESRWTKGVLYAGSALVPISRVNDNAHFTSQALLGWWLAYLAASAVDSTDNPNHRWRFIPYANLDSSGLMAEYRF